MKYAIIQCVNGNFTVVSEHGENLQAAKVAFHDKCRLLWNASDVQAAVVVLVDNDMNVVENYREYISHET